MNFKDIYNTILFLVICGAVPLGAYHFGNYWKHSILEKSGATFISFNDIVACYSVPFFMFSFGGIIAYHLLNKQ